VNALSWLKDWGSVIGATIAALASLATLALGTALTFRREQRKALWEQELRRFLELEEAAGRLTEELSTYELRVSPEGEKRFWDQHNWLKAATGRFRRYPRVHAALREFNHAAAAFYQVDKRTGSAAEYDERGAALESAFQALIGAADIATRRPPTPEA
jgi:hypothetical protein